MIISRVEVFCILLSLVFPCSLLSSSFLSVSLLLVLAMPLSSECMIHWPGISYLYKYIIYSVYRVVNEIDMELHIIRTVLVFFLIITTDQLASNLGILLGVFLLSCMTTLQYFKHVPFYNPIVSQIYGTCIVTTLWLSINGILLQFVRLRGHIIILVVILPLIYFSVRSLRIKVTENALLKEIEDTKDEELCLFQLSTLGYNIANQKDAMEYSSMRLVHLIHAHLCKCTRSTCPLHNLSTLYDAQTNTYATYSYELHQDSVFLKHFLKEKYKECFAKFSHSPMLCITYSYFLFSQFSHIEQAYIQLLNAKNRANIIQNFVIYRYM